MKRLGKYLECVMILQQLQDRTRVLPEFKLKCGEKAQLERPTTESKDLMASLVTHFNLSHNHSTGEKVATHSFLLPFPKF